MDVYYVLNLKKRLPFCTLAQLRDNVATVDSTLWCLNPLVELNLHSTVQESNDTLLTLGAAMEKHDDIIERQLKYFTHFLLQSIQGLNHHFKIPLKDMDMVTGKFATSLTFDRWWWWP